MAAVNAVLALILLALCVWEWRTVRRLRADVDRLETTDRVVTDPTLRRAVADDWTRRYLGGRRA